MFSHWLEQTPRRKLGRSREKNSPKHTHARGRVEGVIKVGKEGWRGSGPTVARERKARMEMSRHDYSNTVIKEEMLFFKLSG